MGYIGKFLYLQVHRRLLFNRIWTWGFLLLRNLRASTLIHRKTSAGQEPLHCLKSRRMPGWQRRYSGKPPQRNERTRDIGRAVLYNALPLLIYGDAADYEIPAAIPYLSLFFAGGSGIIQKRRFQPLCPPAVNPFPFGNRVPPKRRNKAQQTRDFFLLF